MCEEQNEGHGDRARGTREWVARGDARDSKGRHWKVLEQICIYKGYLCCHVDRGVRGGPMGVGGHLGGCYSLGERRRSLNRSRMA